jgi:hypothetical protein
VIDPPITETAPEDQPGQPEAAPTNDPSEDEDKLADPRMIPKTEGSTAESSVRSVTKDEETGPAIAEKSDETTEDSSTSSSVNPESSVREQVPLIDQLKGDSQMIEVKAEEALMVSESSDDEETALVTTSEGRILIDSGATGNLMNCQWAETHIPGRAVVSIDPSRNRGYRFANAQSGICSSELTVRTKLGVLKFDILETEARTSGPTTPALLGIRTLRELGCMLDLSKDELKTSKGKIQLSRGQNGHLYIAAQDFFEVSTAALSAEETESKSTAMAVTQPDE